MKEGLNTRCLKKLLKDKQIGEDDENSKEKIQQEIDLLSQLKIDIIKIGFFDESYCHLLEKIKSNKLSEKYLKDKSINKIIFVKNRLINLLINE